MLADMGRFWWLGLRLCLFGAVWSREFLFLAWLVGLLFSLFFINL